MRKLDTKKHTLKSVTAGRAKNLIDSPRTSFKLSRVKSLTFLFIFSFSTLASLFSAPVAQATISLDTNMDACIAAKGTWESDNSSAWCSKPLADWTPALRAEAWAVTNAFIRCVANSEHNLANFNYGGRISAENLETGMWFENQSAWNAIDGDPHKAAAGYLIENVGERGEVLCNAVIPEAAEMAGYGTDYRAFYCAAVPVKADGTSCTGNSGGDYSGDNRNSGKISDYANEFYDLIKRKAFRAQDPPIEKDSLYLLNLSAFQHGQGCHASQTSTPGTNENKIYRDIKIMNSAGTGFDLRTFEGENRTDRRWVYTLSDRNSIERSCQEIADAINANADGFLAWAKKHPTEVKDQIALAETKQPTVSPTKQQSCNIDGVGWLICPVMRFMSQIVDQAYGAIAVMLKTPAVNTSTSDENPMYKAWSYMRNFANIAFVIAFLIIIFSQLTSIGLNNYNVKKMLPRLIVAAILVNSSYWICAIAVDISNILGVSLKALMDSASTSLYVDGGAVNSGGGGGWDILTVGLLSAVGTIAVLYLGISILLPMLIAALFAIVTVVLVLTLRQALIIILIVISPLAFVAYLLPNTEKWFNKWRELFQVLLLMFPIIAVVFGGSALASTIIANVAESTPEPSNFVLQVMAAGITIIPLFIVPVVMKTAGGLLNRFGGMVNNPNKGPFDRLRKGADGVRERSKINRGLRAMDPSKQSMPGRRRAINFTNKRRAIASGRADQFKEMQAEEIARMATAPGSNFAEKVAGSAKAGVYQAKQESYLASIDPDKLKLEVDKSQIANAVGSLKLEVTDPSDNIPHMMKALKDAAASGDSVKARAAQEVLMNSGAAGIKGLRTTLMDIDPKTETGVQLRKDLASSGVKASSADIHKWSVDGTRSLEQISQDGGTWSGLSDTQIAGQNANALEAAKSSGGISEATAKRVLAGQGSENIGADERKVLEEIAGSSSSPW